MRSTTQNQKTGNRHPKPTTITHRSKLLAILLVFAFVLAACRGSEVVVGDPSSPSDNPGDPTALDGHRFWSTSVSENGEERPLVEGTRIYLQVAGDNLAASGGCNTISGRYRLNDNQQLAFPDGLFATEIGCDPELHAQDDFVEATLHAQPQVSRNGDVLVLTTDTVTIEFIDQSVADPDRPVTTTRWIVNGFIDGEFAMTMTVDPESQGWIELNEDSQLRGFDGCAEFNALATITDTGTGSGSDAGDAAGEGTDAGGQATDSGSEGTVTGDGTAAETTDTDAGISSADINALIDADGTIQFSELTFGDCDELSDYSQRFRAAFETGSAAYAVDGPRLTLLNTAGHGVDFTADE